MEKNIKVKSWKAMFGERDITNEPIFNRVWLSKNGFITYPQSPMEDRSVGTMIIPEIDDDRMYYRAVRQGEYQCLCSSKEEAEEVLAECEQAQRECEHCDEEDPLDF